MNKKTTFILFILGNIMALGSFAMSYKVKDGDTLSTIGYKFFGNKVYGKKGSL